MRGYTLKGALRVVAWSLGVVTLTTIPYLVAYFLTPPETQFSGLLANPLDGYSYLAKMRQGAEGAWLSTLPYTSEEHPGVYLFPYYIVLGKVASFFGAPLPLVYHGARILGGVFLLVMAYYLFSDLFEDVNLRHMAFGLAALGSGLSWLTGIWGYLGTDYLIPESNLFHSIFVNPHFPLATGLLLAVFLAARTGVKGRSMSFAFLAGLLAVGAVMTQPFLFVTIAGVLFFWAFFLVQARELEWQRLSYLLPVFLFPLPPLVGTFVTLYYTPVFRIWTAQNVTLSPPPWDYLLGYGVVGGGAFLGLVSLLRASRPKGVKEEGKVFLITWLLVGILLLYLPVPWQRRLSEGLHVPMSGLAALGFKEYVLSRISIQRWYGLTRAGLVMAAVPSSLLLLIISVLAAAQLDEPFYVAKDDLAAFAWLRTGTAPQETLLASPIRGNQIPAWVGRRVFWGHPFETIDAAKKQSMVEEFFSGKMSSDEREGMVRKYGISLVYFGSQERRMGSFEPGLEEYLVPAYSGGEVTIYRVRQELMK